jgi:hypothetical protein
MDPAEFAIAELGFAVDQTRSLRPDLVHNISVIDGVGSEGNPKDFPQRRHSFIEHDIVEDDE